MNFKDWMEAHVFTASDLEAYRLCPYRFYAQSFLKLKPETRNEVEMTPPETGRMIHRVLEKLLSRSPRDQDRDVLLRKALEILEREIASFQAERPHLSRPLLKMKKALIERMLSSFLQGLIEERSQKRSLAPRYFEWNFGGDSPPLALKDADGRPVSFRGRVDRIDVDESEKRFLVIDYKTGSTKVPGNRILAGDSFQLPLYLLAVQTLLLRDYEPIGAVYHQLSDMTKKDGLLHADRLPPFLEIHPRSSSLVPGALWESTLESLASGLARVVSEIRNTPEDGFLSHAQACEPFCPYRDICRLRATERALETGRPEPVDGAAR